MDETRHRNELLLKGIADAAGSLIYATDLEGRFIFANEALEDLFGVSAGGLLGKTREGFLPAEVCEQHRANDLIVIESGAPLTIEETSEESDGVHTYLSVKSPLRDSDGRLFAIAGVSTDITAQRRAEELVERSEALYRELFERAPIGYQSLDADGHFITVNEAWVEVLGYSADEAVGRWFGDLLAPEYVSAFRERFPIFKAAGAIHSEFEMIAKDGQRKWVAFEGRIGLDAAGSFKQTHCVLQDITEQRRVAEALRQSEARFRTLVEQASDGIFLTDETGHYVEVNSSGCEMLGYTRDEILRLTMSDVIAPDDLATTPVRMDELRSGKVFLSERRFVRKDGSVFSVEISARMLPDGRLQGMVRDINERKLAEDALRESDERYRALFEDANDAVYVLALAKDVPGRFIEVNGRACAMLGYTSAEFLDMETSQIDVPEMAERSPGVIEQLRTSGFATFETEHVAKDGRRIPVEVAASLISVGGVPTVLSIARDITERRRSEEQLARALTAITEVVSLVSETRDPYTAGHQRRVSKLSVAIAAKMGMPDDQVEEIRLAALIHDVGKMSIPAEILSKPGALLPIEFELIKGHSGAGYKIIAGANMEGPFAEIVYQHHERCDGSGYPRGLAGDQLLPGTKVIMVADVVEAMASHRPYRAALGIEAALAEIEAGAGSRYDADVSKACVALFREGNFEFS